MNIFCASIYRGLAAILALPLSISILFLTWQALERQIVGV